MGGWVGGWEGYGWGLGGGGGVEYWGRGGTMVNEGYRHINGRSGVTHIVIYPTSTYYKVSRNI